VLDAHRVGAAAPRIQGAESRTRGLRGEGRAVLLDVQGHTAQQTAMPPMDPHTFPAPQSASDEQRDVLHVPPEMHTVPEPA